MISKKGSSGSVGSPSETPNSDTTIKSKKSFMQTVSSRVSIHDPKLNHAIQVSSRIKTQQRDKQLAILSQRIKRHAVVDTFNNANSSTYMT